MYHHPTNYLSYILYIYAEPNKTTTKKEKKETKIDKEKEEQKQTKDKDKINSDKNKEKSDNLLISNPAYKSFFPIKRIIIPEVYETIPNGQIYRFQY